MQRSIFLIVAAVMLLVVPLQMFAKPRPPGPPWPEAGVLCSLGFDDTCSNTNAPVDTSLWQESWSGYALVRAGQSVLPYTIPMAVTNRWDLAPVQGTIRCWYSPSFASGGPGHRATLLQLSAVSGANSMVVWSLYLLPNGSAIALDAQGDSGTETVLNAGIAWASSQWHLLTLAYSGTQTLLYVDDVLTASGGPLPALPASVAAANGRLTVGSSLAGAQTAEGSFDELTTFYSPIKAAALADYYAARRPTVDLGPITAAEVLAQQQKLVQERAAKAAGLTTESDSLMTSMVQPMDQQQGLYLLAPSFQSTNILLNVQGGSTNQWYTIRFSDQVFDGMTENDWTTPSHGYGAYGQTNFIIPTQENVGFYRVLATTGIPPWQLADPANTNSGFLTLTIDSPTNGSTIH